MAFKILVGGYTSMITALSYSSGSLSVLSQSAAGSNPSWLALNPSNSSILYANQESYTGQILAFTIDPATAALTQKSSSLTGGANPAHFAVLYSGGGEIVAANYDGASTSSFILGSDRTALPSSSSKVTYSGFGPNANRQSVSHPHQVVEYIIDQELLVPDLGSDKIWRLSRSSSGAWQNSGYVQQPAGSGPRHMVPHDGNLYVVHELSNTLTQQTLPPLGSSTQPQFIATLPTLPSGSSNTTVAVAELLLSPKNCKYPTQYLYATNRNDNTSGGDSIAIFSMNPLTLVAQVRTGLSGARGAAIGGPNGEYLVVGGQNSGGVVLYQRTSGGAALTELARLSSGVTSPTSFVFLPTGEDAALCA